MLGKGRVIVVDVHTSSLMSVDRINLYKTSVYQRLKIPNSGYFRVTVAKERNHSVYVWQRFFSQLDSWVWMISFASRIFYR